jgi:hypothetical protein
MRKFKLVKKVLLIIMTLTSLVLIGCFGENLPHKYSENWRFNENYHWRDAICGCNEVADFGRHSNVDGACSVCSMPMEITTGVIYELSEDGIYAAVVGYNGTDKNVRIASEYKGKPVTNINNQAFENSFIEKIFLPETLLSIGDSAFSCCDKLTSIVIPEDVTAIGEGAFYRCESLKSIEIPNSVTSIGGNAFAYCFSLTSVVLDYSGVDIDWRVFSQCRSLTSVVIGDSVTLIGDEMFDRCSSLESIIIPESVTAIGHGAFSGCNALTSAVFEDKTNWYRAYNSEDWKNRTGGIEEDFSSDSKSANRLKFPYYWYKID